MPRAALLLWFLPSLALAQAATAGSVVATETSDRPDEVINLAECNGTTSSTCVFSWTLTTASALQSRAVFYVSDNTTDCTLQTDSGTQRTVQLQEFSGAAASGTTNTFAMDQLLRTSPLAVNCSANVTLQLCVYGLDGSGNRLANATALGTLRVDVTKPGKPVIRGVDRGEAALFVRWDSVSGADRYRVEATPAGGTSVARSEETDATDVRVGGLVNGQTYDLRVIAISEGGNESDPSDAAQQAPSEVNDFWEAYKRGGGNEQGGCGVGGFGALALLGLVPLALRLRRRDP
jgi:hypothetical protein